MAKRGLLLLNLGTPDSPQPDDVGRYLKEFLMDRWVIDIPAPLRWFFVNVLIVPKRKHASGAAYKTIWTERGSPLLFHLRDLALKVGDFSKGFWQVEIAMRYGKPSIESGLAKLADCDEILVFPLYPQYAESSTRTSREECERQAKRLGIESKLKFVKDYFDHPSFIGAYTEEIKKAMDGRTPDRLLLSFHGLPERHVMRTDPSASHCLKRGDCCSQMVAENRNCYRAQCFATARAITRELGLPQEKVAVSFQSRLGRTPWIQPFTDVVIPELAQKENVRSLVVACPSFAADCLETIEEIGDRAQHLFKSNGGREFAVAACPNASDTWASGVLEIASEYV